MAYCTRGAHTPHSSRYQRKAGKLADSTGRRKSAHTMKYVKALPLETTPYAMWTIDRGAKSFKSSASQTEADALKFCQAPLLRPGRGSKRTTGNSKAQTSVDYPTMLSVKPQPSEFKSSTRAWRMQASPGTSTWKCWTRPPRQVRANVR